MNSLAIALLLVSTVARADVAVCFTPGQHCVVVVAREIAAANHTIRVQAYSFTSPVIEQALVDAHARGVDVQVILDRSNLHGRYSGLQVMERGGVPTSIDSRHAISHNKIIIVDGTTVLSGSYNFTVAAEKHNAENLLVIRDAALAAQYGANWDVHRAHAVEAKP